MTHRNLERVSDLLTLTFGQVLADCKGSPWVFTGWVKNTEGLNACFYPSKYPANGMIWKCAYFDTLCVKFPEAVNLPRKEHYEQA